MKEFPTPGVPELSDEWITARTQHFIDEVSPPSPRRTRRFVLTGVGGSPLLVLSRVGEGTTHPLTPGEMGGELSEYAQKKNVCLMSTLQLLAVYKEIALNDGSTESIRNTIQNASGWLHGFNLEPGSESDKDESSSTNKLSSLLSA